MLIVIASGLPEMPRMVRASERFLNLFVHLRRNAVHRVRLSELPANDGHKVELFAQESRRINEHGCSSQRDQELLGRGAIDSLDAPPHVQYQLVQCVAGLPIGKLELT